MSYFILLFAVVFTWLAWRKTDWAVLAIIFGLPFYLIRFEFFGLPSTVLELMIIIAFLSWLAKNFKPLMSQAKAIYQKKQKRVRYPFDIEIILVLTISFSACFLPEPDLYSLGIWRAYFLEPIIVFFLLVNVFGRLGLDDKNFLKNWGRIVLAFSAGAFLLSLFAIYQKITGDFISNPFWAEEGGRRVTSFFEYPNALALYLAPLVMVFIGYFFFCLKRGENKQAVWIGIVAAISVVSIYFARSEGALIALFFSIFVFAVFAGKYLRVIAIALAVSGLCLVGFSPGLSQKIQEKLLLKDLSGEIRKQQWQETWQMFQGSLFWTGAGLGNYQEAILPFHQEGIFFNKDRDPDFRRKIVLFDEEYKAKYWQPVEIYLYPHNIFLNFWTELGFLGMLAFTWIVVKYFYYCAKLLASRADKKYLSLGIFCAMIVVVVHGFVDVPYFKNDLAALFWVLVALCSFLLLNKRNKYAK